MAKRTVQLCSAEVRGRTLCPVVRRRLPVAPCPDGGTLIIQTRRDGLTRAVSPLLPTLPSETNLVWIRGYAHRESTILTSPFSREHDLGLTSDSALSSELSSSIFLTELNLLPHRP